MRPGKHDWEMFCGATFRETVYWKDSALVIVDLNDYNGRMEIRDDTTSGSPAKHVLSTDNGGIIPLEDGGAQLFVSDTDTRLIGPGNFRYDLLFEHKISGDVTPLLQGRVRAAELVTQDAP